MAPGWLLAHGIICPAAKHTHKFWFFNIILLWSDDNTYCQQGPKHHSVIADASVAYSRQHERELATDHNTANF